MCNFINKNNFEVSNFYRLPKALMSKKYDSLMLESKVAYSFLLDMVSLSIENNWVNDNGEVFVKIRRRELMKKLGVRGSQKMAKIMEELKNFGLVFEEKLGFGRCNKIFLYDLESTMDNDILKDKNKANEDMSLCHSNEVNGNINLTQSNKISEKTKAKVKVDNETISKSHGEICCGLESFENQISKDKNSNFKGFENKSTKILKSNFKGFENKSREVLKSNFKSFDFQRHNKTNINKTKNIKTNLNKTQSYQDFNKTFDFKTLENNNPQVKDFEIQNSVDKVNNFVDEVDNLDDKKLEGENLNHKESKRQGLSNKENSIKVPKDKKYDYDTETLDTARELLGWAVDYKDVNILLNEACGNLYILDLAYEKMVGVKSKIKNIIGYLKTVIQTL